MNVNRLKKTLATLNQYGYSGNGINRLAYSIEEQEAKRYLVSLFKKEKMKVKIDAVGNIIARREGNAYKELPAVVLGSHIDTVYNGGEYDGTVGVIAGLEVIRYLNEQNIKTKHPIEVIVFSCEESARFGVSTIGSKAMTGMLDVNEIKNLVDKNGVSIRDAVKSVGLDINQFGLAKRKQEEFKVFYELHIEQGPLLEFKQKEIGIVTSIAAPTRLKLEIIGQDSHSGSTPMHLRRDSFSAAAEISLILEQIAIRESENDIVATIGDCKVYPGAINVVPGKTVLKVDIRGISKKSKDKVVNDLIDEIKVIEGKRGIKVDITILSDEQPVTLDETIISSIEETCVKYEMSYLKMPSGGGHDAMNMAALCPTGLIFIPSKNGLSHNKNEFSTIDQIKSGTMVLRREILKAASQVS